MPKRRGPVLDRVRDTPGDDHGRGPLPAGGLPGRPPAARRVRAALARAGAALLGREPAPTGYQAFMSYSHAVDGRLAPVLQANLERFGKPWYASRAIRVFRDDANLSAAPGLWPSLEEALAASEWFVLLASPTAARSPWVQGEVDWWLTHRGTGTLLVVLTSGELAWGDEEVDPATSALPPNLRGAFPQEPRWVDVRWLTDPGAVDASNPTLQDNVADISAAIRRVPKDVLVGEHVHQHRRTVRLARGAVLALVLLLVATAVGGLVAVDQRDQARRQATLATSHAVLARAEALRGADPSLAAQLMALAYRISPTPNAYTDLLTTQEPSLSRSLRTGLSATEQTVAVHDGLVVVAGEFGSVQTWDVGAPGGPVRLWESTEEHGGVAALSPDGETLALSAGAGSRSIQLLDVSSPGDPVGLGAPLEAHGGRITALAFSPDGRSLASGSEDATVRLWDLGAGPQVVPRGGPLTGHTDPVRAVAFGPDGRLLASADTDGAVRLWALQPAGSAEAVGQPLTGTSTAAKTALAFSPDSTLLATGSADGTVRLWYVAVPEATAPFSGMLQGHGAGITSVAFSPDGRRLASGSADRTVRLWDVSDPELSGPLGLPLTGHGGPVASLAFDEAGATLVSAGSDGALRLWDVTEEALLPGNEPYVRGVALSPDGRTAALSSSRLVQLVDLAVPDDPRLVGPTLPGAATGFTADGHLVVTTGRGGSLLRVADPSRPAVVATLPDGESPVRVSADGRVLVCWDAERGVLTVWDVAAAPSARRIGSTTPLDASATATALGPDGRLLAVPVRTTGTAARSVALWDVGGPGAPTEVGRPLAVGGDVHGLAFAPDGRTLALGGSTVDEQGAADGWVELWDVADPRRPERVSVVTPGLGAVSGLTYRPDGRVLVARGGDGVRLLDTADPAQASPIGQVMPVAAAVNAVAFRPDGAGLLLATQGLGVELWSLDPEVVIAPICSTVGDTVDPGVWRRYLPDLPHRSVC